MLAALKVVMRLDSRNVRQTDLNKVRFRGLMDNSLWPIEKCVEPRLSRQGDWMSEDMMELPQSSKDWSDVLPSVYLIGLLDSIF